jgi:predicted helicase
MSFTTVLNQYRKYSFSERDKGNRFERLIQAYLQTDPKYSNQFKNVWLWSEFPYRNDFGGNDTGIDIVTLTHTGDFWAVQCKCYQESTTIDKPAVDSFLSTSSRQFKNEELKTVGFSQRLWVSSTNKWGPNAENAIHNQIPPVTRLNLSDLENAPVDWEKLQQGISGANSLQAKKTIFPHQKEALEKTNEHFKTSDRGKLIMACGTGKTYTSLKIAENETNCQGLILFLVPSISLLGQTLNEWYSQANEPINAICICSDSEVSKKKTKQEDIDSFSVVDLALPASTDVKTILKQFEAFKRIPKKGLTVVFSTYQSIDVIAEAQKNLIQSAGYGIFDLIICDEAHRTTGVTLADSDDSAFVKVHNNDFIKAKKRLYMTATPRIFSDDSKSKADKAGAELWSMDKPEIYGEEIYRIGFGEAVEKDLLSDYKVLILTLKDTDIPQGLQHALATEGEISTDDVSKLIGCINALSKQILGDEGLLKETDPEPMRTAVAFCQSINNSKEITSIFNKAQSSYKDALPQEKSEQVVTLLSEHVDGTMRAPERDYKLSWLKASNRENNECRVLTNARCLSEGIDVPSLDAVLFLSARNSQVDVVQSVGRVMRKAPGKKYGYIIIPVVVPSDIEPDKALDDNARYRVVWTVLNALRAHDDRFNATVNKIELNKKRPKQIIVGRIDTDTNSEGPDIDTEAFARQLTLQFEQLQSVVFAKMVEKVGDRRYWEQWAQSVAEIAERQMDRIKVSIKEEGAHKQYFNDFLAGLRKNINPSITDQEAIEMLSQHIITKPVFDALFEGYSFVKNNPVSVAMQGMLDYLESQAIEKDTEVLDKFYESVKMRARGIDNAEGKQRIIIELYDKFFKTAFPKMVEKLGIVYTPVECVDFIIHSVNDVLQKEFGRSISDENIHILDPFTGTGTFITRLIQSGLIKPEDLLRKYKHEIHANEIVLLAYYIAAVNIENAFHDATPDPDDGIGKENYIPFDGICLTDTFQLGETDASEKLFSEMFPKNSERVQRQKKAPLRVIMGNPPYSVGQKSENDNAQNQEYIKLNMRIENTYAKEADSGLNKSNYDSYIKAFRWASDRLDIEHGGIITFITNSGWIEKDSLNGFRKCIEQEFSSIYVFNLRGSIRGRSGNSAKKEGQNVFDIMTGVAITVLVKKPSISEKAIIHYYDIGDYLSRNQKFDIISNFKSVINPNLNWNILKPNEHADWVALRTDSFSSFYPLDTEKKFDLSTKSFFNTYAVGVSTNRDSWVYNYSKFKIENKMKEMIDFYNQQLSDFKHSIQEKPNLKVDNFIDTSPQKISWTVNLKKDLEKGKKHIINENAYRIGTYRPFVKQTLYFDKSFIERPGLSPMLFPNSLLINKLICITGLGERNGFSIFISNCISNLDTLEKTQCFPLYYYEENKNVQKSLFDTENSDSDYVRRDGISDFILNQSKKIYGNSITKEDIFYYVYGFLHSPEYKEKFANDLKKMLPRLPLVDEPKDFWKFSKAGRALAELHLNYEKVPPYDGVTVHGAETLSFLDNEPIGTNLYHVEKMRFPKKDQKDTIIYNSKISIEGVPDKAYQYIVNGKSAIEWIMERYQIITHKESGIKNDPNDWAIEVGNPRYILDLLLSIINVSVKTVDIVNELPKVKFD